MKELIGKTIINIEKKKLKDYDDNGYLEIEFNDGLKIVIEATYGCYTGDSEDEYPTDIKIINKDDFKQELV